MFNRKLKILLGLSIVFIFKLNAQLAFQNFGNIQIHDGGALGFHIDLVNDGIFENNLGSTGFYNVVNSLKVSGENKAVFNNVDIDVTANLYLDTSMQVTNNLAFISGNIVTPKDHIDVSLEFKDYNVYAGEGDYNHVNGYVSTIDSGEFIFPIGDGSNLRPLIIPNQLPNTTFKGAYFNEDPNNPSTFTEDFDTSSKELILDKISDQEFWDLDGSDETDIILIWNNFSNISRLTTDIRNISVVGWDKTLKKWMDLGGEFITGTTEEGTIRSVKFIPDNFEVLTLGSNSKEIFGISTGTAHNFAFSPNGDGINDFFVIDEIKSSSNNTITIFNRWGAIVYKRKNYNNTWNGISDHKTTINKNKGLPTGTYFYILEFHDENISWTGYIYLGR